MGRFLMSSFRLSIIHRLLVLSSTIIAQLSASAGPPPSHIVALHHNPHTEHQQERLFASLSHHHLALDTGAGESIGAFSQLDNFKNTQYSGEVSVGTPPQLLRVIFDTGSANMWVYSSECTTTACQLHSTYSHEDSQTYKDNGTGIKIKYGSGWIKGYLSQDVVKLGSLEPLPDQMFGEVTNETGKAFVFGKFDGIMGMAFPSIAAKGTIPVFDNLMKQQVLKTGIFSFFLSSKPGQHGALLLGGVDQRFPHDSFVWVDVISPMYWQIQLKDIAIDREPQNFCHHRLPHSGGDTGCRAAIDTGTSLITGPSKHIKHLLNQIHVAPDCSNIDDLPTLEFQIHGSSLQLFPKQYILQTSSLGLGRCVIGMHGLDVPPPRGPLWVLGDIFMRSYYTVFNRENSTLGFAACSVVADAEGEIAPPSAGSGTGFGVDQGEEGGEMEQHPMDQALNEASDEQVSAQNNDEIISVRATHGWEKRVDDRYPEQEMVEEDHDRGYWVHQPGHHHHHHHHHHRSQEEEEKRDRQEVPKRRHNRHHNTAQEGEETSQKRGRSKHDADPQLLQTLDIGFAN